MVLFKNFCFLGKIFCCQPYKHFVVKCKFFWQKFQTKNIVEQRRTMEGKTGSMKAKKNIIKGVIDWICFSCWQSQVFLKELDLFSFPCFVPKLSQFADLVQTMAQVLVSNTAEDAALVLCLRQHMSSNFGGGALKGEKSTDPDFLVNHYENFLLNLFTLTLRPSSKHLERTVLKAHDGISVNDAREWAKRCVFSVGQNLNHLYQSLQTAESGSAVTLPVQKRVLWKGASKLSPQKQKAKTPQKEKAVASSPKRKKTSEGASASKLQSILAAWGAETVESFHEEILEVESSQESYIQGWKKLKISLQAFLTSSNAPWW